MKSNDTIRYFPFAPGIPWKIRSGKYVVPGLNSAAWNKAVGCRDVVVLSYGGLFESFVSLSLFEIMNYSSTSTKLMWSGTRRYEPLVKMNGLATVCPVILPEETTQNYPVPVFLDKSNNVYFNCLNNYIRVNAYYGEFGYKDHRPVIQQLTENFMIPWETRFLPQFRNLKLLKDEIDKWTRLSKFQFNRPYVCVFPDCGLSQHKQSMLGWSDNEIKALAAMLRQVGISTLVFTDNPGKYYASSAYVLPAKVEYILLMLKSAKAVLAEEIDLLLIAEMVSSARIIAKPAKNELNLYKNQRFLGTSNVIDTIKGLTPVKAFNAICGES